MAFLYEEVKAFYERPLRTIAVVVGSTAFAFLIGYAVGYTEPFREEVRPRVRIIEARDRERFQKYLANTVAMASPAKWRAGRTRSQVENRAVKGSATKPFDYGSLPPEIRTEIAWYALGGAHVYLPQIREVALLAPAWAASMCKPHENLSYKDRFRNWLQYIREQNRRYLVWDRDFETKPPYQPAEGSLLAIGLLAASKQSYQETHHIYWSTNIFHLARGSYKNTEAYLSTISPTHVALIQQIQIDLSVGDLTPDVLRDFEQRIRERTPLNNIHTRWAGHAAEMLLTTWQAKLLWVRKHLGHVSTITLRSYKQTDNSMILKSSDFFKSAEDPAVWTSSQELGNLMLSAVFGARDIIEYWVHKVGWENFKEYLAGECEQSDEFKQYPLH
ncbi:hypothetical protein G7Y79_00006g019090 [Physcia stellaris]|nr:hypothetical protein G7Y79_00006g019090 [Physcia stellaris]